MVGDNVIVSTGFHRKLTPLPPDPTPLTHGVRAGCEAGALRADGPPPVYNSYEHSPNSTTNSPESGLRPALAPPCTTPLPEQHPPTYD